MPELKARITEDMKNAMRGGEKRRLGAIRLVLAAIKQVEVDTRLVLDDAQVVGVLEKMLKQRRDSLAQYESAGRQDLAEQEAFEIDLIQGYMPQQLSADELGQLVSAAVAESGASSMRDMGKVMALLKDRVQGRADMGQVSALVKQQLGA